MNREAILEFLRTILIAFAIAFVINLFRIFIFTDWNEPRFENFTESEPAPQENTNNNISDSAINPTFRHGTTTISLTPMENFSGLSKAQILAKRNDAIHNSPFFSHMANYSPNPNVFQISDGLPWISAEGALHWSKSTNNEKTQGVSRDSIGILNPELLYTVSLAENEDAATNNYIPLYKDFYFVPYDVKYNANTNTITAYIRNAKNNNGNFQGISLNDANAHDLGFRYAFMDNYQNIGFYTDEPYKSNTLAKGIKETTGYYTQGSACGIPGGCNNYAPYWQYYNNFYLKGLPASVNIKLWKNKPNNHNQKADINYQMIFE